MNFIVRKMLIHSVAGGGAVSLGLAISFFNMVYWVDDMAFYIGYTAAAFAFPTLTVISLICLFVWAFKVKVMSFLVLWLASGAIVGALVPPILYVVGQ